MQVVNFDSDDLFEELNRSAESESDEERDHRHMFPGSGRRRRRRSHSGQDRKRRRRPRSSSHFLVGDEKVSLFSSYTFHHLDEH